MDMEPTLIDALRELVPDEKVVSGDPYNYDQINFHGLENPPTKKDGEVKLAELQSKYDAQEYARKRQAEYPNIIDQLDEIYHNGIDSWKAVIKKTKDKYPKG